jgi:hypothetical protein
VEVLPVCLAPVRTTTGRVLAERRRRASTARGIHICKIYDAIEYLARPVPLFLGLRLEAPAGYPDPCLVRIFLILLRRTWIELDLQLFMVNRVATLYESQVRILPRSPRFEKGTVHAKANSLGNVICAASAF